MAFSLPFEHNTAPSAPRSTEPLSGGPRLEAKPIPAALLALLEHAGLANAVVDAVTRARRVDVPLLLRAHREPLKTDGAPQARRRRANTASVAI